MVDNYYLATFLCNYCCPTSYNTCKHNLCSTHYRPQLLTQRDHNDECPRCQGDIGIAHKRMITWLPQVLAPQLLLSPFHFYLLRIINSLRWYSLMAMYLCHYHNKLSQHPPFSARCSSLVTIIQMLGSNFDTMHMLSGPLHVMALTFITLQILMGLIMEEFLKYAYWTDRTAMGSPRTILPRYLEITLLMLILAFIFILVLVYIAIIGAACLIHHSDGEIDDMSTFDDNQNENRISREQGAEWRSPSRGRNRRRWRNAASHRRAGALRLDKRDIGRRWIAAQEECTEQLEPLEPKTGEQLFLNCGICREDTVQEDFVRLPCTHSFHLHCIARWIEASQSNGCQAPTCPFCRDQLLYSCGHRPHIEDYAPEGIVPTAEWKKLCRACHKFAARHSYTSPTIQPASLALENAQRYGINDDAEQEERDIGGYGNDSVSHFSSQ